jgi:hypothetical protein
MSKKKKVKHSHQIEESEFDFLGQMGLFPDDVPFGTNVGCGGKSTNKDVQKPKSQKI